MYIIILGIVLLFVTLFLVPYVFGDYGLMKIAQRHNVKYSWLAWVPVANAYIYGKVAFKSTEKALALFALKAAPLSGVLALAFGNSVGFITSVFSLASMAFFFYAVYKIYKQMSDKAVLMLIFSVLSGGVLVPFFIFAIRNNPIKSQEQKNLC